jgi:exonuclease III
MRIATWNVNSLRVRLPQMLEWLARAPVHVLARNQAHRSGLSPRGVCRARLPRAARREDRDVHDPVAWAGSVHVSAPEREALRALVDLRLSDLIRRFEQPPQTFSWWDYRMLAFRRNHGLRIDLMREALATRCSGCHIDREPRRAERPCDHAPVVAEFELPGEH